MFCAILYGEIRTLEKCIPSIKRLFSDILNVDFYVVINKSKNIIYDYEYYEKLIIDNLSPKSYELVDISQSELANQQKQKHIYKTNTINTYKISFSDYSKLPFSNKIYSNDELQLMNAPISPIHLSSDQICSYPYNQYIEDYLINIAMSKIPTDKYSHIFRLRTDVIWFDNCNIKRQYTYMDNNKLCLNNEYNEKIDTFDFNTIYSLINNNIHKNEIIISSLYPIHNVLLPCAHAQLMPFHLFKKYVEFFNDSNFEQILSNLKQYPILYPHWGGELQQKRVFQELEYVINTDVFLSHFSVILRM
jgi:hypothetical protein